MLFDDGYSNAGAEHLADIFGTEKDRVNCPFYWKIGACRHGEKCSRNHNKPALSQTLLIPHMYPNPQAAPLIDAQGNPLEFDPEFLKEHFEEFYEDVFDELSKYGRIEELNVCDNIAEHMLGNVYVKYSLEEEALKALRALKGRFYAGRVLTPEFSPVTDFKEARCKQFEQTTCERGGNCNFMHLKRISSDLGYELFGERFRKIKNSYGNASGGSRSSMREYHSSSNYHHHHHSKDSYYDRDYESREHRSSSSHRHHHQHHRGRREDDLRPHKSSSSSRRRSKSSSPHRSYHRSSRSSKRSESFSPNNERTPPPSSYDDNTWPVSGEKRKRENKYETADTYQDRYVRTADDGFNSSKKARQEISDNNHRKQ
jgi:splicing factor U2AF subunit